MRKRTAGIVGVTAATAAAGALVVGTGVMADQVILDDLIVDGSICVGLDCVNGESFGFDTLRLKENNLRIKFDDTSTSASFPRNDWQITINDSSNGGAEKFSIDDISNSRTPFTIEANAPSHSFFVDDGGRIGFGTSTPVTELHVKDGDTPTLRLEQDGSSGFTPQTWDVAGNETNFFIRDATNGSRLPFRIRPSAPSESLFIDTDGDVGLGTSGPSAQLDVRADGTGINLQRGGGAVTMQFTDQDDANVFWVMEANNSGAAFSIARSNTGDTEFRVREDGSIQLRRLASAPTPRAGGIYLDTSGGVCVSDGATWTNVGPAGDCT